jgi:hypothetical protein
VESGQVQMSKRLSKTAIFCTIGRDDLFKSFVIIITIGIRIAIKEAAKLFHGNRDGSLWQLSFAPHRPSHG